MLSNALENRVVDGDVLGRWQLDLDVVGVLERDTPLTRRCWRLSATRGSRVSRRCVPVRAVHDRLATRLFRYAVPLRDASEHSKSCRHLVEYGVTFVHLGGEDPFDP